MGVAIDGLAEKMNKISTMLQSPDVTVIYVHCSAGCDRTGEFVAAYRMLKGDFKRGRPTTSTPRNISDIYAADVAECGRPPNYFSSTALKWFCFCNSYDNMTVVAGPKVEAPICEHFASCKTFGDCTPVEAWATTVVV